MIGETLPFYIASLHVSRGDNHVFVCIAIGMSYSSSVVKKADEVALVEGGRRTCCVLLSMLTVGALLISVYSSS